MKKNLTISEYQRKFKGERWLKELFRDAVSRKIISLDEWTNALNAEDIFGINPVDIMMSAMIQMIVFDPKIYDFLKKYGISDSSILRMIPVVQSFFHSKKKIVNCSVGENQVKEVVFPTLSDMLNMLQTIAFDLAKIGIQNKVYYISREGLGLNS